MQPQFRAPSQAVRPAGQNSAPPRPATGQQGAYQQAPPARASAPPVRGPQNPQAKIPAAPAQRPAPQQQGSAYRAPVGQQRPAVPQQAGNRNPPPARQAAGSARPAQPPQPQRNGNVPPAGYPGNPPGRVPPAQPGQNPPRSFNLHISSEEFRKIPDPPAHGTPGGGEAPPLSGNGGSVRDGKPRKAKKKKKRGGGGIRRGFEALFIALGLVGCSVALAFFGLSTASDMFGMNKPDVRAEVVIPEGTDVGDAAEILKEAGIITQTSTFSIFAHLTGKTEYVADKYDFNSKMAYNQILKRLTLGNAEEAETVRLTFPEGTTIVQTAQMLEEKGVCSAKEFLEAANTGTYNYAFMDQIPDNPLRFNRLEGYIFPDTYDFYIGQAPDRVVDRFLSVFNTRVTQDLYEIMEERGLTLDQTITLASIIQKETGNVEDMYLVSSVFHNRLAPGSTIPQLQSDATTDYIEKQIKPNLSAPNQAMFDAYDTRVCIGLPVGPINNPGKQAIEAALDPAETKYYFFLSDQKGEYHYSETLAQHNAFLQDAGDAKHGTGIEQSGSAQ